MDYKKEVLRLREERIKKRKRKTLIWTVILVVLLLLVIVEAVMLMNINRHENNEDNDVVMATAEPTAGPTAEPTIEPTPEITRRGTAEPIPPEIRQSMAGYSMPSGASITYDELSYLTIPHYDFNYNVTEGHLIVNAALAEEVLDIFAELFDIKYPVERMELIDKYDADDYLSIEYNNTSAFNYRESTDGSGRLSKHALGRAIDINPQINPYVNSNGTGAHSNAREYWSRDISRWTSEVAKAAYIGPDTEIYNIFVNKYGWEWGGAWSSYRDYQHFQKFN